MIYTITNPEIIKAFSPGKFTQGYVEMRILAERTDNTYGLITLVNHRTKDEIQSKLVFTV